MKKKIISIMLAVMLLGMTACKGENSESLKVGNVQVRTAYSTEKILQDKEYLLDNEKEIIKIISEYIIKKLEY